MDSILTSIKKLLGIEEEYEAFDTQLIIHINSAFNILFQLGVGPETGYSITGNENTWDEFLTNPAEIEMAKTYVFLRVYIWFDQTLSGPVISSMERQIEELTWRLNVAVDPINTFAPTG